MKKTNTPDGLTGTSFYSLMHPQDCMEIREEFSQSKENNIKTQKQKYITRNCCSVCALN